MKIRNIVASLALSFLVAVGGGIVCKGASAPDFNAGNFEYVTNGAITYHYGKEGTPFYGFLGSTQERYWELEATKSLGSSTWCSDPQYDYGNDGQTILDFANKFSDTLMNVFDKSAMVPKTVNTTGYEIPSDDGSLKRIPGEGSLKAYMWAPSKGEYDLNQDVGGKVCVNSRTHIWSRSYYAWHTGHYVNDCWGFAHGWWHIDGKAYSSYLYTYDDEVYSAGVAPAFQLDLTKVLKVKLKS